MGNSLAKAESSAYFFATSASGDRERTCIEGLAEDGRINTNFSQFLDGAQIVQQEIPPEAVTLASCVP